MRAFQPLKPLKIDTLENQTSLWNFSVPGPPEIRRMKPLNPLTLKGLREFDDIEALLEALEN